MTTINSVLGPLNTRDLGFTLMHEHVISQGPVARNFPELFGPRFLDRIVTGITEAREGGVKTIVDATTFDLGRDVNFLAEISRRTGVNIVASSGWWMSTPSFLKGHSPDLFADIFVREIEEGIGRCSDKARGAR